MLSNALQKPVLDLRKHNPDPWMTALWVTLALVAGGTVIYLVTRPKTTAAADTVPDDGDAPTVLGGQQNCAAMVATQGAPYGFVSDGQGGCAPSPIPDEAANCNDRQVWDDGTKKCVTPPWNKIWGPPSEPVDVPLTEDATFEFQLRPSDGIVLDQLGYQSNDGGVLAFQGDFNLVNAILIEQGDGAMGGILLTETGTIRDEVRSSMGWALAYANDNNVTWMEAVDRVRSLPGI